MIDMAQILGEKQFKKNWFHVLPCWWHQSYFWPNKNIFWESVLSLLWNQRQFLRSMNGSIAEIPANCRLSCQVVLFWSLVRLLPACLLTPGSCNFQVEFPLGYLRDTFIFQCQRERGNFQSNQGKKHDIVYRGTSVYRRKTANFLPEYKQKEWNNCSTDWEGKGVLECSIPTDDISKRKLK